MQPYYLAKGGRQMFRRKDKEAPVERGVDEENLKDVPQRSSGTALSVCPTCGRPSDGKADVCPGCGGALKDRPVWK
jgi:rubrerythrin